MNYLKYTQYVYLIAAVFFTFKAVEIWNEDNDQKIIFIGIAALSVCMFFFRRKFAKKFEDRSKNS